MEAALMLRNLNLCLVKVPRYRDQMGGMFRRVSGLWLACAAVLVVPSVAAASVNGGVGGWRTPASGPLTLNVAASPEGPALATATATLDGVQVAKEPFADGSCSAACPARVDLRVDTKRVDDGQRELVVWVTDTAGTSTELLRQSILVENDKPDPMCPEGAFSCEVTIQIGSATVNQQPSPPDGGVGGETARSCASPRLSMRLASKPLRYRRGVPVLVAGRTYRYRGELTCRVNGRRRGAPPGTEVQVRNRLRGWTISKPSLTLRKAGGEVVRVRIPIRVVHVKKGRR
jgi:hypothetical protein